jgi:hypothetical protein
MKRESNKSVELPRFTKLDSGYLKCLVCLKTYSCLGNARTHYYLKHTEHNETYSCTFCRKLFNIKRYLQIHTQQKHRITQKMLKNSLS